MSEEADKISEEKPNPWLKSPKTMHFEMPLYEVFGENEGGEDATYHRMFSKETVDSFCPSCLRDSIFNSHGRPDYSSWRDGGALGVRYQCNRGGCGQLLRVLYLKEDGKIVKYGQYPSVAEFQIPQMDKYAKVLPKAKLFELKRGVGLAAHGAGIGSFVYLRRVFEFLIDEAKQAEADEDEHFDTTGFEKAHMVDKIELLKDRLPAFLSENKILYSILSKGIHELEDEECLRYFKTVKVGIEMILDEKVEARKKELKAEEARKDIHATHQEVADA